ncbi:MAG: restriction endonuclease subunit S [Anaerolineae bacterium]|nr:restriction endonuclease subunit S [Anaerolineae bacterium]
MSSSDWETFPIGSLCEDIFDGPHATPKKIQDGPIFLGISNLANGRIDLSKTEHLSEKDFIEWTRRVTPKPNDLVFSYETRLGEAALIPNGLRCCLGRRMGLLRFDTTKVDPKFMLYAYLGPEFQQTIRTNTIHGSTVDRIPLKELPEFLISIPPLPTQRRIANILSALDDKIELNRQTNATLEAIAQAIFKEWFVDFNFPGATGEMEESELGLIPVGWRVGNILEIAYLLSGGTPSTRIAEYWDGDIPWVSAKDVSNSKQTYILDTERKISLLGINNSSTKILRELTTIVTARGTVGNYSIIARPMAMNQTNYGLKAKVSGTDYFIFYSLGNLVAQLQKAAYGTIFDTVTTRTFEQSKIVIPSSFLIRNFDKQIAPMMKAILNNLEQSVTLSKIRDRILPKLMRGEIEV